MRGGSRWRRRHQAIERRSYNLLNVRLRMSSRHVRSREVLGLDHGHSLRPLPSNEATWRNFGVTEGGRTLL